MDLFCGLNVFLGGIFLFSSPEFTLAGEICQKPHLIWSIWAPRAPFVIYTPIWSHHPDFHTQITRKYSTAKCYSDSICRVLVMMMNVVIMVVMIVMMMLIINQLDDDYDHITHFGHISLNRHFSNIILIILL